MPGDFCQIFHDDLDYLYTLSLLLTVDLQKAEQCFVAGLEDCLEGNPVFREWAQSWAKRTVIKNAIRMISPMPTETILRSGNGGAIDAISEVDSFLAATKLLPFDRFVYVLSVLEKYSDPECAILLGCRVEEIVRTRTRAIHCVVSIVTGQGADELVAAV
jgi:hypothetical protein